MQGLGIIKDNVVYGNGYLELLKTIFHHPSIHFAVFIYIFKMK